MRSLPGLNDPVEPGLIDVTELCSFYQSSGFEEVVRGKAQLARHVVTVTLPGKLNKITWLGSTPLLFGEPTSRQATLRSLLFGNCGQTSFRRFGHGIFSFFLHVPTAGSDA